MSMCEFLLFRNKNNKKIKTKKGNNDTGEPFPLLLLVHTHLFTCWLVCSSSFFWSGRVENMVSVSRNFFASVLMLSQSRGMVPWCETRKGRKKS